MKNLLFVDDEISVLKALKRVFREHPFYQTFLAQSGREALEIMEKEPIHLIITNMRMPHIDGYDLLKIVKKKHQDTIRLILSGYADEKLIFKALQDNLAKMYLLKPWNNNDMIKLIERIFLIDDVLKSKDLIMTVNMLEDLPILASFYQNLSSLIESNADIDEITEVIEGDQALASRILRITNSAFYRVKTASIKQAIIYLGYANLKNIILTTAIFDNPNLCKEKRVLLWNHSSLCNQILHLIYREVLKKKIQDNSATAGLLHDIGRIFLLTNFQKKYQLIFQEKEEQKISLAHLEKLEEKYLSISHQEMGAYLLDWWELPLPVIETALFHHNPIDKSIIHEELVAAVHLANYYSWSMMTEEAWFSKEAFRILGTSQETCTDIIEKNRDRIFIS